MSGEGILDPVLAVILRGALGLLFASSALHKLRDPGAFGAALEAYRLLPAALTRVAAFALVAAESATALALLAPIAPGPGAGLAVALLAIYALAIGVNLARGRRDIDCGCAGPAQRQPIGAGLLVRNAVYAAAALALLVPATARPLVWLDALTAVAAVATLAALHVAVQRLMAVAPGLRQLGAET